MKWNTYPAYKNVEENWLGQIPQHWDVYPLRKILKNITERNRVDLPLLSVYRDYGVILKESRDDNFNRPGEDLNMYKVVHPGNLVINKMKAWQGSLGISELEGIVSPAYIVCKVSNDVNSRFLHFLLRSEPYIQEYSRLSYGVRPNQWDMHFEDFRVVNFLQPHLSEQRSIVHFLNKTIGPIDILIAKRDRQIELLQEKRNALIDQLVTKGLDPNVPMKESGIQWFGEIPKHWEVKPFKYFVSFQEGPGIMAVDFRDNGVPLLRIGNLTKGHVKMNGCNFLDPEKVASKWNRFRLLKDDLLISCSATTGIVSKVSDEAVGSIAYTGIIRLRPLKGESIVDFIKYVVVSNGYISQINALKTGVAIQHYGPEHIRQIAVVAPPTEEQIEISKYLDSVTSNIDGLILKILESIEKMKEYRTSLISAAVTGKIDVRKEVA